MSRIFDDWWIEFRGFDDQNNKDGMRACWQAAAASEREACAQVCDYYATALDYGSRPYTHSRECKQAAAAIRARGHP